MLEKILKNKREEVERQKSELSLAELKSRVKDAPKPLDFTERLVRNSAGLPAVIAEVKRASPSKGIIRENIDPEQLARDYEGAGASAISVLTNQEFFRGSLSDLQKVKTAVDLPVLRKDFIIDEYQVYESRAFGADAILLIVAALDHEKLKRLMEIASEVGLQYLVEVHNEAELDIAIDLKAPIVGINNRNLKTFEVSLEVSTRLLPMIHSAKRVSESGIFSQADLTHLGRSGADAVLIGEALMRHHNPAEKLKELVSWSS
ncbi:MAG: indole-3-glycerol phosphate synthase TrpC [Armatimonadota bacterium]